MYLDFDNQSPDRQFYLENSYFNNFNTEENIPFKINDKEVKIEYLSSRNYNYPSKDYNVNFYEIGVNFKDNTPDNINNINLPLPPFDVKNVNKEDLYYDDFILKNLDKENRNNFNYYDHFLTSEGKDVFNYKGLMTFGKINENNNFEYNFNIKNNWKYSSTEENYDMIINYVNIVYLDTTDKKIIKNLTENITSKMDGIYLKNYENEEYSNYENFTNIGSPIYSEYKGEKYNNYYVNNIDSSIIEKFNVSITTEINYENIENTTEIELFENVKSKIIIPDKESTNHYNVLHKINPNLTVNVEILLSESVDVNVFKNILKDKSSEIIKKINIKGITHDIKEDNNLLTMIGITIIISAIVVVLYNKKREKTILDELYEGKEILKRKYTKEDFYLTKDWMAEYDPITITKEKISQKIIINTAKFTESNPVEKCYNKGLQKEFSDITNITSTGKLSKEKIQKIERSAKQEVVKNNIVKVKAILQLNKKVIFIQGKINKKDYPKKLYQIIEKIL
ncbi:MAG: hypothetical protein ACOCP8_00910 [archaeon]